jgi:hypothetical protein
LKTAAFNAIGLDSLMEAEQDAPEPVADMERQQEQADTVQVVSTASAEPLHSLAHLTIAARHPHINPQEREALAAGIFRYGRYLAAREQVLVTAGYVEDAANGFTVHVLRLMDESRYVDSGVFRGWLSSRWRDYHWKHHTKKAVSQRDNETGLQTWAPKEGEEYRAETGRKMLDLVLNTEADGADAEDYFSSGLAAKLPALMTEWTTLDKAIYRLLAEGFTQAETAAELGVSKKTVQRWLISITGSANRLNEPVTLQACAEESNVKTFPTLRELYLMWDADLPEEVAA